MDWKQKLAGINMYLDVTGAHMKEFNCFKSEE